MVCLVKASTSILNASFVLAHFITIELYSHVLRYRNLLVFAFVYLSCFYVK
jgi:hypothetical protein